MLTSEYTVNLVFGSSKIMKTQQQHLRAILEGTSNVDLRIIPSASPISRLVMNNFSVYDRQFVAVETLTRGVNIWSSDEVSAYVDAFLELQSTAVMGKDAVRLLRYLK